MTISTTGNVITLAGNGGTTTFSFSFVGAGASDIFVTYTDLNGVAHSLSTSDYTLGLNPASVGQLWGIGGTVTYPISGSPIASGTYLTIERTLPLTQDVSISNQGAFYPQAVEQGLDKLEMQIQQLNTDNLYTMKFPQTDTALPDTLPSETFRQNKYLYFDASGQPTVTAGTPSTSSLIGASTKLVFLSAQVSLSAANALADSLTGTLVIDKNWSLTADLTITAPIVWFTGGIIDCNGHNLEFQTSFLPYPTIQAGPYQIIETHSHGGHITGAIMNTVLYPEWLGALPGSGNSGFTNSALVELEAFNAQSGIIGDYIIQFSGGAYYLTTAITNGTAGKATRWFGVDGYAGGPDATNVTQTGVNLPVRIFQGASSASGKGVYMKNLYLQGNGSAACIEVRDWCFFEHTENIYDGCAIGVFIRDNVSTRFAENVRGHRNLYNYGLTSYGIKFQTDSGTDSFRGFSETQFVFSRSHSAPATGTTFIYIDSAHGSWVYGAELTGTVTNLTNDAMYVIDCQAFGCFFRNFSLDVEQQAGGSITFGKTNPCYFGGPYTTNGSNSLIKGGTAVFDCTSIFGGAITTINRGWAKIDPFVISTNATFTIPTPVIGGTVMAFRFVIDDAFDFSSVVEAEIAVDTIGTAHYINKVFVNNFYNGLSLTFTTSQISVNSSGQLTFTINASGNPMTVSGVTEYYGGRAV
jgi:hypothetical protein